MSSHRNPHDQVSIVIADPEPLCRQRFACLVKEHPKYSIVAEVQNGIELITAIENYKPRLILTELDLPYIDGIAITRIILKYDPSITVVGYSNTQNIELIQQMRMAGARACLPKNPHSHQLFAVLDFLLGDNFYTNEGDIDSLNPFNITLKIDHSYNHTRLTEREVEIIRLTCLEKGAKEIASRLESTTRAIETARERIRQKIGAKNVVGVVLFAVRNGVFKMH